MLRSMFRFVAVLIFPVLIIAALLAGSWGNNIGAEDLDPLRQAPEFTQAGPAAWINSKPLALDDLRGKVILLDFWTFGCWNCYRSFPWLKSLEARFEDEGLQVIGVHTPEFAHEKIKANVVSKVKEFGLHHPVMIDNDFAYWNAIDNQFWPAYYLLDKQGRIRGSFIGETHTGDANAREIEAAVAYLLAEGA